MKPRMDTNGHEVLTRASFPKRWSYFTKFPVLRRVDKVFRGLTLHSFAGTSVSLHLFGGEVFAASTRASGFHWASNPPFAFLVSDCPRLIESDVWIECIRDCHSSPFLLHASTRFENLPEHYSDL